MEKLPLTQKHIAKLAEYGLQDIPLDACSCLRFSPGETIFREGLPISWLGVVISGRAKVCRTAANGRSLILCYYISSGVIGELELIANREAATTTVTAITDFECIAINSRCWLDNLKTNMEFHCKLEIMLAQKLLESSDRYTSAALCSGEERLCAYIVQTSNRGVFNDILTDVSCSVGMSYRHVFRLLARLCEEGILEKRNSGYLILNRPELIRRANLNQNIRGNL